MTGRLPSTVPVEKSREMVAAMNKAGGRAKLTEFPGVRHVSWVAAYRTPGALNWLFDQKRRSAGK